MAVYVIPRRNIWVGNTGILDFLGKALIDPMINRDKLAREYTYNSRLLDQNYELGEQGKQADFGREQQKTQSDREYNSGLVKDLDTFTRENPDAIPGIGGAVGTLALLNGGKVPGDMNQLAQYMLPTYRDTDTGGKIVSQIMTPAGTEKSREEFVKSASPQDLLTHRAQMAKIAAEREQAKAKGEGADNWLAPFTKFYEAVSKYYSTTGELPFALGGLGETTRDGDRDGDFPQQISTPLDLVNWILKQEAAKRYGPMPTPTEEETPRFIMVDADVYDGVQQRGGGATETAPRQTSGQPQPQNSSGPRRLDIPNASLPIGGGVGLTPSQTSRSAQASAPSRSISSADLARIAQQEGMTYEEALADAEAQGIRVIN